MVSLFTNNNNKNKKVVEKIIEKWNGGGCNYPKKCKFETFLVSSYIKANCCARCGIRFGNQQGTNKMASCSACNTDICYSCKKEIQKEKKGRNNNSSSSTPSALTKTTTTSDKKTKGRRSSYSLKSTVAAAVTPSTKTAASSKRTTRRHSAPSLTNSSNGNNSSTNHHHGHQMCVISCILGKGSKNKNKEVEMMVDSGASNSAISYGLAKRLKLDRMMNQLNGQAFGVGSAQIVGRISNVPCTIVGKKNNQNKTSMEFPIDFLVLDGPYNQEDLLLLGLDQMRKHGCMIDLSDEIILFGGRKGIEVPMVSKKSDDDNNSIFSKDCRNLIDDAVSVLTKDDLSV